MGECKHNIFEARVDVNRLSKREGGPITNYTAEVQVRCRECKAPFAFKGVPGGSSYHHPTVSVYGEELRAPIELARPGTPSWEDNEALNRKLGKPFPDAFVPRFQDNG